MKTKYLVMMIDGVVDSVINLSEEDKIPEKNFFRIIKGDEPLLGQEIILRTFLTRLQHDKTSKTYSLHEVVLSKPIGKLEHKDFLKALKKGEQIF